MKKSLVPTFFEKPKGEELNPIRLLYNSKKYKYYYVATYKDTYQAYLDPQQFHASGRLPFEFDKTLRAFTICLLYTSPSPRDKRQSRMPSSA